MANQSLPQQQLFKINIPDEGVRQDKAFIGEGEFMKNNLGGNYTTNSTITLLKTTSPSWVGKQYSQSQQGVEKKSKAYVTEAVATSRVVETASDLVNILSEVTASTDLCIVPDQFVHAESDETFTVVTESKLKSLIGSKNELVKGVSDIDGKRYAARLKASVEPSKWLLIDCDNAPGMPDHLRSFSIRERLEYLEPLIPGISMCERVELRSSSSRVTMNDGGPRSHAWIAVNRPDLIEKLREHVRINMVIQGLYFDSPRYSRKEPGKQIGSEPRTVIDLAVWVNGRIVFNSLPQIDESMPEYQVVDADIKIVNENAGVLDITWVDSPITPELLISYRDITGHNLRYSNGTGSWSIQCEGVLKRDTEIEVKGTVKPLEQWATEIPYGGKLRCEAPFRASNSEAAVIFKRDDGAISVYDIGNQTTYPLSYDSSDFQIEENKVEVEKPVMPEMKLTGLLANIADYAYETSLYPSRSMATFTAFATFGALVGYDYVAPSGLKLSQYTLVSMPTSTGKDSQKRVIEEVLRAFDKGYLLTSFAASRQALHDNLTNKALGQLIRNRGLQDVTDNDFKKLKEELANADGPYFAGISVEDEVHRHFNVGTQTHKSELRDFLLELYTATDFVRPVSSMTNKYVGFRAPAYSVHGFSTPSELAASLGDNASANGLVGRFMVYATNERPRKNYSLLADDKRPRFVVPFDYDWLMKGQSTLMNEPVQVVWDEGAREAWIATDRNEIEPMKEEKVHAELGGRLGEQVIKLASLLAINDATSPIEPVITPSHVKQAWQYRKGLHYSFLACMNGEGGIGRSEHAKTREATAQAIKRYAASNPGSPMPISVLNKCCMEFKNLPSYQRDGVIKELTEMGVIVGKVPSGRGSVLIIGG